MSRYSNWLCHSIVASKPACRAGDLGLIPSGRDLPFHKINMRHYPHWWDVIPWLRFNLSTEPRDSWFFCHCSCFLNVRYVLSSMTIVSIIYKDANPHLNTISIYDFIYIIVLVFQFFLIRHEFHYISIYNIICFVYMNILFIQVQVSIKFMLGNQCTQFFQKSSINNVSFKCIMLFLCLCHWSMKSMKWASNYHFHSIVLLSLRNTCPCLVQKNRPRLPFHSDIIIFGCTI